LDTKAHLLNHALAINFKFHPVHPICNCLKHYIAVSNLGPPQTSYRGFPALKEEVALHKIYSIHKNYKST
jgi:hypothetical protein